MLHTVRILIADEDREFTRSVCKSLHPANHFSIVGIHRTGDGLLDAIEQEHPDVVVLDLMLPGMGTLAILRELSKLPQEMRPTTFVVSAFTSLETAAECNRLGVNFFLRKPIEAASLADLIARYAIPSTQYSTDTDQPSAQYVSLCVKRLLGQYGIPVHVMGYRYLHDCIVLVLENPSAADSVTKILYPSIAKKHKTTWTSVERDIRNAISIAWERSDKTKPGFHTSRHPTNREFILTAADHARYEMHLGGGLSHASGLM